MPEKYTFSDDPVAQKIQQILDTGALPIHPSYTVATGDQGEVVYNNRRLLVTENDASYHEYTDVLRNAGLPYVANNLLMGDERVVVGEIPRDARVLTTLIRGVQPEESEGVADVFNIVGKSIRQIIDETQRIPDSHSFDLDRILVIRSNLTALLVPPIVFSEADAHAEQDLVRMVSEQLIPKYDRFGAAALLASFEEGLGR